MVDIDQHFCRFGWWINLDYTFFVYPGLLVGGMALVADLGKAVGKKKIQL